MNLLGAFITRDFLTQISYRSAFVLSFVGIFFRAFTFFFIAQLVGPSAQPLLGEFGGDYFAFVLLGIAFNSYFGLGLNGFARSLRQAQTTGTLEAMLVTPTPVSFIIIGSAAWNYLFTTFRVLVYIGLGLALGMDLSNANWLPAIFCLLISIISFAAIGIIAAGIIMIIKRGDPVTSLIGSVSALFGGIYYPIELLPDWLKPISAALPITYSLRTMRKTLLTGAGFTDVWPDLLILLIFCFTLFPIALWLFRLAVNKARSDGTLAQY
ncbi:MAG: ABC transporter permease [Chloroflexota bacterium]